MRNDIKRFAVKVCETTKMIRYVAAAIAVLFSLQTSAAVYLKAAAEGEERAVQNGESWATAYPRYSVLRNRQLQGERT
jgi:hypothetical protein